MALWDSVGDLFINRTPSKSNIIKFYQSADLDAVLAVGHYYGPPKRDFSVDFCPIFFETDDNNPGVLHKEESS